MTNNVNYGSICSLTESYWFKIERKYCNTKRYEDTSGDC